jgi:enterochelin esterase-like enzyme
MSHRQEAHISRLLPWLLSLIAVSTLFLTGCQGSAFQSTPTPDLAATQQAMPTRTATSTPQPTATPTQSPTPDCLSGGGELTSDHFYSTLLDSDFFFHIYLPPCYDQAGGQSYPVVYLLHGLSYTSDQWPRLGLVEAMNALVAAREVSPFIVVMPLEATFTPPQTSSFARAIAEELIPWVDSHYHTLADKQHRAIGGVSRGAAWSVQLGFEHTDLFASVGAHSLPLFESDEAWLIGWVTQTPLEDIPRFFIDIGRDDQEWPSAQAFADLLDQHSIPHEWYFNTGGHTEAYWSSHLIQYLTWYAQDW